MDSKMSTKNFCISQGIQASWIFDKNKLNDSVAQPQQQIFYTVYSLMEHHKNVDGGHIEQIVFEQVFICL